MDFAYVSLSYLPSCLSINAANLRMMQAPAILRAFPFLTRLIPSSILEAQSATKRHIQQLAKDGILARADLSADSDTNKRARKDFGKGRSLLSDMSEYSVDYCVVERWLILVLEVEASMKGQRIVDAQELLDHVRPYSF